LILIGCTITTTKSKTPVFNDPESLNKEIGTFLTAESMNVVGKENTTNGKTSSALEITVTNPKNVQDDDDLRRGLGKAVAKKIKFSLKDTSEYSTYTVSFVKKVVDGTITKSNSRSYDYTSEELSTPYMNVGKKLRGENGFVYGGTIFSNSDTLIISILRDIRIPDSSQIDFRLYKVGDNYDELMGKDEIKLPPDADYVWHTMRVEKIYKDFGAGKFRVAAFRKERIIASAIFELK